MKQDPTTGHHQNRFSVWKQPKATHQVRLFGMSLLLAFSIATAATASALPIDPFATRLDSQPKVQHEQANPEPPYRLRLPVNRSVAVADTRITLRERGIISNDFNPPAQNWNSGHRGIDFAADPGEPVLATTSGTVSFSGQVSGKGVITIVDANGLKFTNEPVDSDLTAGTHVTQGAIIGIVAPSPNSHCSDKCVHIGVRQSERYLDPWPHLGGWTRIVLLN